MPRLPEALYHAGHRPFDFQLERLIALLRIALSAFSLVEFYTDPRVDQNTFAIVAVLIAYTVFGLIVAAIPIIGHFRTGWQLPVHLVDVGLISLLLYFEIVSRQLLLLYTFVLLSATVRWNWRGAAWTTAMLLGLGAVGRLARGLSGSQIADNPNVLAPDVLTQGAFLLVIGGMFTFFGASRERSQVRLAELALWPAPQKDAGGDLDAFPLAAALAHVASVLQVPRVLVLWEQSDEPFLHIVLWANGRCRQDRKPADAFGDWTSADTTAIVFASADASSKSFITTSGTHISQEPLISRSLEAEFQLASIASAPFSAPICTGRIFMLDKPDWGEDDLTLTEIAAARIGLELEHHALRLELADTATAMERVRVARDLHDGILQSLTAAGLHLKAVASELAGASKSLIDDVRRLLLDEQQRIRIFVDERQNSIGGKTSALHPTLQKLIDKNQRQWRCQVVLSVTQDDTEIRSELARQLDFILGEAIGNAVRHGQASRIDIIVKSSSDRLLLWIRDNGHGAKGAAGFHDAAELAARKIGPVSLRNRIAELSGSLTLSSSPRGVELHLDLPK